MNLLSHFHCGLQSLFCSYLYFQSLCVHLYKTKTTFTITAPSQASGRFSNPITALLVPVELNGFPLGYAHLNLVPIILPSHRGKGGNFIQMAVIIEMLEKLKCFII